MSQNVFTFASYKWRTILLHYNPCGLIFYFFINIFFMKKNFYFVSATEAQSFGRNQRNRNIDPTHVKSIKKAMLENHGEGLLMMPPITINKRTKHIIDGQHRWKAFLELTLGAQEEDGSRKESEYLPENSVLWVMEIDIPEQSEFEVITGANTNSKSWSLDAYIESYTQTVGKDSYLKLRSFCEKHPICGGVTEGDSSSKKGKLKYRYGAAIITGRNCSTDLKKGDFTVTDDQLKFGHKIHEELVRIKDAFGLPVNGAFYEQLAIQWHEDRKELFSNNPKDFFSVIEDKKFLKTNQAIASQAKTREAWHGLFSLALAECFKGNKSNDAEERSTKRKRNKISVVD